MFDADGGQLGELGEVRATCSACLGSYRSEFRAVLGADLERFVFEPADGDQ